MTKTVTRCDVSTCDKEITGDVYRTVMMGKQYELCSSCHSAFQDFVNRRMVNGKDVVNLPINQVAAPTVSYVPVPQPYPSSWIGSITGISSPTTTGSTAYMATTNQITNQANYAAEVQALVDQMTKL
jgi:hypothetical protein